MEVKILFSRNWWFLVTSLMFSISFPAYTMADDVVTQETEVKLEQPNKDGGSQHFLEHKIFSWNWRRVKLEQPKIDGRSQHYLENETFSLNCTIHYQRNRPQILRWTYPPNVDESTITTKSSEREEITDGLIYQNLIISKASKGHNGTYVCISGNGDDRKRTNFTKIIIGYIIEYRRGRDFAFEVTILSYPPANIVFLKDGNKLPKNPLKYSISVNHSSESVTLLVKKLTVTDTGKYKLIASNKYKTKIVTLRIRVKVEYSTNEYSKVALLRINSTSANESGAYTCLGTYNDGSTVNQSICVHVEERRGIHIMEPETDEERAVIPSKPISLNCIANAVPKPTIQWFKDGETLLNDSNVEILSNDVSRTLVNSTIHINHTHEENEGKYECVVGIPNTVDISARRFYNLSILDKSTLRKAYLWIIGLIFFLLLLLVLVLYLFWKIRKEKQFRKDLAAAGLLYWKEGVTGSINPDLMIDEQAELLPYDEKFEFPPEKLKLGKQIGAGAFGVVYKAEARGIVIANETTTVAVKMVKKMADNMDIKTLASELKIMVHLGKHINIVNLLGACTKNIRKRELIVIVEYCKYGCLHSYLQKHREVFIDQLTDSKEKTSGLVKRRFYSSSINSSNNLHYLGFNHTQPTGTILNTSNTNRSAQKVSEPGYVQPEWRSNYESDYSYDGRSPRPLCSRDLLCWAFQIARGMDYLATRKVLHGDLAARNILLAEDNVVKICDFGLARTIYKNYEYQKKENSPLPVKWLAIECMTDRIFSTQSDIWSFGVVLWELFSLSKTPYPNISLQGLLRWLLAGNRLERPLYADDRIYDVMRRCWDQKPTLRPNFTELHELLGSFLEDSVRNYYIDLNSPYSDMNSAKSAEDVEDYLAMVCAPDYNNMITSRPQNYKNQVNSLLPNTPTVQLQHDDEGYLPRTQTPELNIHSELTPMLTLNNLPAHGGSETDQEGSTSPYLNTCPRIDEESDDVFEKQHNAKNNAHNIAVSNPAYITYDCQLDNKPQNLAGHVNVNVANGQVK